MEHSHPLWSVRGNVCHLGQDIPAVEITKVIQRRIFPIGWLLIMAALGSWFAVMSLDNEPPYTYDVNQSHIIPDPAPQGAMITVDWAITVRRACPGSVQRTFRDMNTGLVITLLIFLPLLDTALKFVRSVISCSTLSHCVSGHLNWFFA